MKPFKIYQMLPDGARILYASFTSLAAAQTACNILNRAEKKYPKYMRAIYILEGVR